MEGLNLARNRRSARSAITAASSSAARASRDGRLRGAELLRACILTAAVLCSSAAHAAPAPDVGKAASGAMLLASQAPMWSGNPDVAAFEARENGRLAAAQKAIAAIHAVQVTHTLSNTLTLYDEALRELNTAVYLSSNMEAVHPDAAFRDRASAMTRKVSAAQTALSLDPIVYHALAALDISRADPPTRHYLERQLLAFRLGGVDKDAATRARLGELNDQLTEETSAFERNINDDHRSIIASAAQLEGLPSDYIEHHKPNDKGEVTLSTDYPDLFPVMSFARSDELRQRMYVAFENRAYPVNRGVLERMLKTRYDIATALGYSSWADYFAADKMIGAGAKIAAFLQDVEAAARPDADREFRMLLAEKQKHDPQASTIELNERNYYQEQVRRASYDFDSQSVRPYFPYPEVRQGVLDTAATLFHIAFRQDTKAQAWAPDVETWVALDQGIPIGRFYLDMPPRPGKFTHAEMSPVLDGVRGKQLPEAILICNFPRPTATDPGLMTHEEVTTFFHEFGHLMHWILGGQQAWAGISGISMETDFVEAPSQMLEEWMHSPQVLASFAHHYQTGEPIPASLVERMNRADAFGRAGWVAQQDAYSAVSYDIYSRPPESVDLDEVNRADTLKYTPFGPVADTHDWASFGHLAGYSSAYYTYLWDKVIAEDFFGQFDPKNLLSDPTAMRYRRTVLEPGGSESANDLVRNFLGRPQQLAALRKWIDAEFRTAAAH
jgi:thimet oligopeptidase